MKHKIIHFTIALIIYGILGFLTVHFFADEMQNKVGYVIFWSSLMAFAEIFILEKIRIKFKKEEKLK